MKKTRIILVALLVLALMLAATACACTFDGSKKQTTAATTEPPAQMITIIANGASDYAIVQPSRTSVAGLSNIAMSIRTLASGTLGVSLTIGNDSKPAVPHEILIGDTSRPETATVAAKLAATASDEYFQYVVAYENGKVVLYAECVEAYSCIYEYFAATYVNGTTLAMPEDCFDVQSMTWAAYNQMLADKEAAIEAEKQAELQKKIDEMKALVDGYRLADFGRVTKLISNYEKPPVYPTENVHPRILVTPETLDTVRANLDAPENEAAKERYLELSEAETTGKLSPPAAGKHNSNSTILSYIEAKAFRYLMTGEELYGYEAIYAIKNYILTLNIPDGIDANDTRLYSWTIYITACVYDWCYDLLTTADKMHLLAGIMTKIAPNLEMGFPPSGQGAVVGHGTEDSIYRDWLALAIACSDDFPDVYEFVAGRLFQDYSDAGEFYMQSGSHWQGSAYGPSRYYFMLISEAIIRAMTNGKYHLFSDNLELPAITFMHYIRPDGQGYRVGDDYNEGGSSYSKGTYYHVATLAAFLYDNPQLKYFGKTGLYNYGSKCFSGGHVCITAPMLLCLNNPALEVSEETVEDLPLVLYNGSPLGSIIARSAWDDKDAVSVYMKIGEAYSMNHEHKDAGNFQIYYKGILASDSGYYDSYGTAHDLAYHKQTIAHNSLLIYNPKYSTANSNTTWQYSGGQSIHRPGYYNREYRTLAIWMSYGTAEYAKILGHGYETTVDASGTEQYLWSYLAGDLSNAYDTDTVDEVSRYMISIMTDDPENPMVFLVFDRITAVDASFKKTFLLHMQQEPTLDSEGKTATVINTGYNGQTKQNNSGKMHVQSLLTDVTYTAIGGVDKEFMVGDKNYPLTRQSGEPLILGENSIYEAGWGRIEISPVEAKLTDHLLTVMYVTDAANEDAIIRASEIRGNGVVGAEIFGKTVLFPQNDAKLASPVSFTTNATSGTTEYFITGLTPGQWSVSLNGKAAQNIIVDDGILHFEGEVGTVTLTPAFSTIEYVLNGGRPVTKLPESYNFGDSFEIPTDLTLIGSEFIGWYTTETFEEGTEFTGVKASGTEPIKLYAKWKKVFYVITLEANDGAINETYSHELKVGEAYTLPLDVTKKNSTFIGWYASPSFEGEPITVIPAERENADMILYARYQTVYYNYDFADETNKPSCTGKDSKMNVSDGMLTWVNPHGESNFSLIPEGGFADRTQTLSFDIYVPEDGSSIMNFQVRLRPEMRNQFDLIVLTAAGGKIYLGSKASGVPMLDGETDTGWHRFTLVLNNENSALQKGLAVEKGTYTTGEEFQSKLYVRAYLDGIYRGEKVMNTYLTFGDGYFYTHFGTNPETGIEEDLTFSTEMTKIQFFSSFKPEEAGCNTELKLDNLAVSDGSLTVGGKYFLVYDFGEPENDDYINGREIVALPKLVGDGIIFHGWYTTSDFRPGTEIEDPTTMPAGTLFYAKVESIYRDIIYELDGGKITDAEYPTKFLPNSDDITLPTNVTIKGGTFLGWYDNADFAGEPITKISTATESAITVYARYAVTRYDLNFNGSAYGANNGAATATPGLKGVTWVKPSEENGQNGYLEALYTNTQNEGQFISFERLGVAGDVLTISFDLRMAESGSVYYGLRLRNTGASTSPRLDTCIFGVNTKGEFGITNNPSGFGVDSTNKIGTLSSSEWTNIKLVITPDGTGDLLIECFVNNADTAADSKTLTSHSSNVITVSDIIRAQFYAGQNATLNETMLENALYFDNLKIECK